MKDQIKPLNAGYGDSLSLFQFMGDIPGRVEFASMGKIREDSCGFLGDYPGFYTYR
jgi:hypothetical protein